MDNVERLMEFGLTRHEASLYILLTLEGSLNGYEAAKQSGISRSNAYNALAGLVDKGAAYIQEEDTVRYTPVAIEEFCSNKIRHLEQKKTELIAGDKRLIVPYKGWNICLQVCYDLRFPVWSRNVNNEYDLLIYVANWPEARKKAWKALLHARAIENMAYVCGVNRVGVDGKGFLFRGDSMIYNAKGKKLADAGKREEITRTCTLKKSELDEFRAKFPAWKDADGFGIDF